MNNVLTIKNNQTIKITDIPILKYHEFLVLNTALLNNENNHCVNYFGLQNNSDIKLFCCVADDENKVIYISSSNIHTSQTYNSFTARNSAYHLFERELHENFGIKYNDHPWLKPVRYSFNRYDKNSAINNYPFYSIDSEELHEVGVGPIHAGIIEPGHFRFICNGEKILHLEIQLGYQHRDIESLFLKKKKLIQRNILAESIAGDTTVGHSACFANLWESLSGYETDSDLHFVRTLAFEIERIAIHTGDLSAICADIAYQLGSAFFGRLRTPIINFLQKWCGSRLGRSLIRAGNNHYPFTPQLRDEFLIILEKYESDFKCVNELLSHRPGALSRLEKTGIISHQQSISTGAVGMTARNCGLVRDIRLTHPYNDYLNYSHQPITKRHGDVYSRTQIRREEIKQSINFIRALMISIPEKVKNRKEIGNPSPDIFTISLVEGWRGEICHCALTDKTGNLILYKIKDPSFHNWMALSLAVRNNEISDFPICNKSFNLSYCGFDL